MLLALLASPVYGAVTSTRIALGMILGAMCFIRTSRIRGGHGIDIYLLCALAIILFGTHSIAFLAAGGAIWWSLSFLFMGIFGLLLSIAVRAARDPNRIFEILVLLGLLLIITLFLEAVRSGVNIGINYSMRRFMEESSSVGLNRRMNTIAVLGLFAFAIGVFRPIEGKVAALFTVSCGVTYLSAVFLSFASGSRQSVLALAVVLPLGAVVELASRRGRPEDRRGWVKWVLSSAGLVVVVSYLVRVVNVDLDWFQRRFADTLLGNSANYGDKARLANLERAFAVGKENFGFGAGPGRFEQLFGVPTENGFLSLVADSGFIGAAVALPFLLFVVLRLTYSLLYSSSYTGRALATVLLVVITVMLNFNELLRDPLFWTVLAASAGYARTSGRPASVKG